MNFNNENLAVTSHWLGSDVTLVGLDPRELNKCTVTVYPQDNHLIASVSVHADQRNSFYDLINAERMASGLPQLTEEQRIEYTERCVSGWKMFSIVLGCDYIGIRNDAHPDLEFQAISLLQNLFSDLQVLYEGCGKSNDGSCDTCKFSECCHEYQTM